MTYDYYIISRKPQLRNGYKTTYWNVFVLVNCVTEK